MINLIKANANFSMAIIDNNMGTELGWASADSPGNVNWVVQGDEATILESHTKAADGNSTEFQCIVRDVGLTAGFKTMFESFWNRLPSKAKEDQTSISFLESLKIKTS